ncbi:FIST signal transduction protein [Clostridium formicaceticum]|uniref:FIST N domain protein n=1 Tax=Clostridium formicaceticum TaxID=1497 RepID=A0AAC9WHB4_9CLOT|nr:FIST N-terminal domain-containing protein [Clostridium formicaceticum]AOY78132.1 hypothetical protein BJL90_21060 [Clostridium formicaceticum]ARE88783.1 FIST N domain protein [Clostridium formicaceticum]
MFIKGLELKQIVQEIANLKVKRNEMLLILIGEKYLIDIPQFIKALNKYNTKFCGGIFPAVIYGEKKYEDGIIIKILPVLVSPVLIKDLKDVLLNEKILERLRNHPYKSTAILLVDGLMPNISVFLSELFCTLGNSVNYIGGGAGSLTFQPKRCVFTNKGYHQNAAVIAFIDKKSNLGVRHGWKRIMGPIVASKVNNSIIHELNWDKAFHVYRAVVEGDTNVKISMKNFFDVAKNYPFGIHKEDSEDIVRDPILTNHQGDLICVGEIPDHSLLYILKGVPEGLIKAASQAVDDCKLNHSYQNVESLVVDCTSRALFLEDNFEKELHSIKSSLVSIDSNLILEGILTLGEISSHGQGILEFFNKTIVAGVLYE